MALIPIKQLTQPIITMKRFALMFLTAMVALVCSFTSAAKDKAPGTPLVCDTVMQAPNLNAEQIYNKAKIWFANNMRSANNVIQLDDAENHHIIGKANFDFKVNNMTWHALTGIIRFTIEIAARDGRYRLKVYDVKHEAFKDGWTEGPVYVNGPNPNVKGLRKKQNSEMQKRAVEVCIKNLAAMLVNLQETMAGNSSVTDEEW